MGKFKWFLTISMFIGSSKMAFAEYSYFSLLIDEEEPVISLHQDKLEAKTKDALLSYEFIEERADYFAFKLKNLTFGEYTDQVLYVAPLFTGRLEFSIHRFNFYHDELAKKSGLKYKIKF